MDHLLTWILYLPGTILITLIWIRMEFCSSKNGSQANNDFLGLEGNKIIITGNITVMFWGSFKIRLRSESSFLSMIVATQTLPSRERNLKN